MKTIFRSLAKHKVIALLILIIGVAIFLGQKYFNSSSNTEVIANNTTTKVIKGALTSTVSASGNIQSANYLPVTTSVNGIVKKVYVTEGEKISKGEKIMEITLDSEGERSLSNAYSAYLKAKNSLDSAKNNLYSAETNMLQKEQAFNDEKVANSYQSKDERLSYKYAENEYLKAKNDYEVQQASIKALEISLNSAYAEYQAQSPTITAAAPGVIANILAVEGTRIENSVNSDRSVVTVASIKQEGTPIAQVDVTEMDINSIKVGQKVLMKLGSIENETYSGKVTGIDKIGSSESGVSNYPVIIKFDEDSELVLPNMSVDADVILSQKDDALSVPTSAIITRNGQKYVTVEKDGATEQKKVETGLVAGTNTEIISGLSEGETIQIPSLPTSGFTNSSSSQNSVRIPGMGGGIGR